MKPLSSLFLVAAFAASLYSGYAIGNHAGRHATWNEARAWAIQEASQRAARQCAFDHKVQSIREESEYRHGWTACMEQF